MECKKYYEGFAKGFEQGWKKAFEEFERTKPDLIKLYKSAYNDAKRKLDNKKVA